jgi:hypothetical protein
LPELNKNDAAPKHFLKINPSVKKLPVISIVGLICVLDSTVNPPYLLAYLLYVWFVWPEFTYNYRISPVGDLSKNVLNYMLFSKNYFLDASVRTASLTRG